MGARLSAAAVDIMGATSASAAKLGFPIARNEPLMAEHP